MSFAISDIEKNQVRHLTGCKHESWHVFGIGHVELSVCGPDRAFQVGQRPIFGSEVKKAGYRETTKQGPLSSCLVVNLKLGGGIPHTKSLTKLFGQRNTFSHFGENDISLGTVSDNII